MNILTNYWNSNINVYAVQTKIAKHSLQTTSGNEKQTLTNDSNTGEERGRSVIKGGVIR